MLAKHKERDDSRQVFLFLFHVIVMQEIDGVLLQIAALVIVSDNHSDVFVSGHALHLAVGESQA